jgi:hypothetical protein
MTCEKEFVFGEECGELLEECCLHVVLLFCLSLCYML